MKWQQRRWGCILKRKTAELDKNSCIVMVEFDEIEYLKKMNDRSVKKNTYDPEMARYISNKKEYKFFLRRFRMH